jgi:hypothetical protein
MKDDVWEADLSVVIQLNFWMADNERTRWRGGCYASSIEEAKRFDEA